MRFDTRSSLIGMTIGTILFVIYGIENSSVHAISIGTLTIFVGIIFGIVGNLLHSESPLDNGYHVENTEGKTDERRVEEKPF